MSLTDQQTEMLAVVARQYGGPSSLRLDQVPCPTPGPGQVVVRVAATSVNPLDWHTMRGEPWIARLGSGLRRPTSGRLGTDLAGEVVACAADVDTLHVGDRVVGGASGAFAQFAVAKAKNLALVPPEVDMVQAAALPVAGITALQAVAAAACTAGSRVLVFGASGGVGTYAVQLAVAAGLEVVGVCSGPNVELVRSLGAVDVVDYTVDAHLATVAGPFDAIIDSVGTLPFRRCKQLLVPGGRYVVVGGPDGGRLIGPLAHLLRAKVAFVTGGRRAVALMAKIDGASMNELVRLLEGGSVGSVVDRVVPLDDIAEAIAYVETRRARGKVVVTC
jgi:NADPH:quinone reductase-like Zn-dependent oxidoreductase